MTWTQFEIGQQHTRVATLDSYLGQVGHIRQIARAMSPFPPAQNHYPGLRRVITTADTLAFSYIDAVLKRAAPIIAAVYGIQGFDLLQASFSMVTTPPSKLSPLQRAPHFDTLDPHYLAIMHYLTDTAGTAFYRHRATGIEVMTPAAVENYIAIARAQAEAARSAYIVASTAAYEQIGFVAGAQDRLIIYPGRLLHSGLITNDTIFSDDPLAGRLTTNIFVRGL
jgi:hypothetical protein